ncbi:hypothetical protein AN640_00180 [Candidatus Epulonipiscium fishelsonii]|uniref:Uncharacterized protein n=1 Tax=Candidatus Epulonipiscium fishelsonii TaxID=77094 RepID=A0ACC8XHU2_9FIRM|nr:hypothetical protein AN640_00180 [Epulopiscium sp. SCG-D08WGA-EpuloA1]OON96188.1 MAG: hypothetical protein ATN32_06625 [Epulopiscium sp. AS2M-Bin002]
MYNNILKCNNCGYDMYGHELVSNITDPDLYNNATDIGYFNDDTVLSFSKKDVSDIICPFCNEKGNWS